MYQHKRGDTLDLSGQVTVTDGGQPVTDLTGWTGRSELRRPDGMLIASLTFTWIDPMQRLVRLRATDTGRWALGAAEMDLQFTSPSGDVISTPTQQIEIVREVTRA
jgi:hypothetical protein